MGKGMERENQAKDVGIIPKIKELKIEKDKNYKAKDSKPKERHERYGKERYKLLQTVLIFPRSLH